MSFVIYYFYILLFIYLNIKKIKNKKINWSIKGKRRKTTSTGRMEYLKLMFQTFF